MVRAFGRAQERNPNISLIIAGRGEEDARIQQTVKAHRVEHVTFLPWIEDMADQYGETDVFLLGSLHEAYGLTLIEALASGVPVVTTDVGCVGELIHNEEHGLVVPVNDEEAFCNAILRMSTDEEFRTQCSASGRLLAQRLAKTTSESYAKQWVAAHSCGVEEV
jgi:glycosyltransferase involved in cell wall biosynthesis